MKKKNLLLSSEALLDAEMLLDIAFVDEFAARQAAEHAEMNKPFDPATIWPKDESQ